MILETLVVSLVPCGISNLLPLIDDSHNALHYCVVAFKFAIAIALFVALLFTSMVCLHFVVKVMNYFKK